MNRELENERYLKILSAYLNFFESAVDKKTVEAVMRAGVDEKTAFTMALAESMGVDVMKEREFFENYFTPSVKKLDVNDYYADPFFKSIKLPDAKKGDFTFKYMTLKAYQAFVFDDFLYLSDGRVIPRIGFFDVDYRYPAVLQGEREWMTLLPNEINSQKKYVDAARGRVATYGLGLGYYVYMVALKGEVSSVTAVDIDENVISLFEEHILPAFPDFARAKVKLVRADALKFGEGLRAGDFDYIYADIWHDAGDGVPLYKRLKQNEKFCPSAKYGYWIEDTMKYYM